MAYVQPAASPIIYLLSRLLYRTANDTPTISTLPSYPPPCSTIRCTHTDIMRLVEHHHGLFRQLLGDHLLDLGIE